MGRRSRRRDPAGRPLPREPRVRGEAANELVRAELEPLAPGEVPRAVKVAAVISLILAVLNVGSLLGGVELSGERAKPSGVIVFSLLLVMAAVGMWRGSYWAVLGFQALIALAIIIFGVLLTAASNLAALLICLLVIFGGGTLFWFLIRAMARIQMPERPGKVNHHG